MSFLSSNQISVGNIIKIDGEKYKITDKKIVKPGKGPAYTIIEGKGYTSNKKIQKRLSNQDSYEKIDVFTQEFTYLYTNELNQMVLLNPNLQEITASKELIGKSYKLLEYLSNENDITLYASVIDDSIIKLELPEEVIVEIISTPPYQKGTRSKLGTKTAKVSGDLEIEIPSNLDGGKIIINTKKHIFVKKISNN